MSNPMTELKRALYKETTIGSQNKVDMSAQEIVAYVDSEITRTLADIGVGPITKLQEDVAEHTANKPLHVSAIDRLNWNSKETPGNAQVKVNLHANKTDNPHEVTKEQVGLSAVTNEEQATKIEFDIHDADSSRHVSASERIKWNDLPTDTNVQGKVDAGVQEAKDYADAQVDFTTGLSLGPFKLIYNDVTDTLDIVVEEVVEGEPK